ncbi:MAG TPA: TonB-dependent hemoglobin/transferrin/lactoferrin family receptor [Beijerinckiaceae bacterium]|jgi:hemoglobin/transferrin/lactoferrin receptor protein
MNTLLRECLRASVSPLIVALALSGAQSAAAQDAANSTTLDAITVTADKVPSTVFDSPSTVSVTDAKEIDRKSINSPRDLAREEPGVSVGNQPARGGSTSYVIRGIGDNRVRIQVDGVKVPDFPETNIGAGTYTRDFVDFDSLKQVEIIRGPASALYGSDAVGGVVSYVTKDPADYLDLVGKNWFLGSKTGFDSTDRSFLQTATGAYRLGPWEVMLLTTRRQGREVEPNGRLKANALDSTAQNTLAKVVYNAGEWGIVRLTGEYLRREAETRLSTEEVTTGGARGQPFTRVFTSRGEDTTSRPRLSFDWTLPLTWTLADAVQVRAFWTEVRREELTTQTRASAAPLPTVPNRLRLSDFDFQQEIRGGEVQFTAKRNWLGLEHTLTYGVTYDFTTTSRPRDRIEYNTLTWAGTQSISGDTFPNKNFPDTDTTQAAAYVQNIMQVGALRIIPAVRFDYYRLEPNPDRAFANSNARNFTIEEQTETAVSPKLGVTYDLTENFRVFGQYARGFRAPPYDNANFGFSNTVQRYEILPNGNLKPETSDGFEGGLRGRFADGSSFQVSGFYNRYQDFLETKIVGTTPAGLTQYQYQNLSQVRIWGVEAKGEWRFAPRWAAFGALAYANGEDEETGQPIDSVDPFTFIAGLRYQHEQGWGAEVRARGAARKSRVSDPSLIYRPDAYATLDAFVFYDLGPNLSLNLGVYNIFDASYFNPQDVAAVQASNPNLELFRAPGRTVALNAVIRW